MRFLISLSCVFLIGGCANGVRCGDNYACRGESIGEIQTQDSSAYWLGTFPDSVTLSNNKGFSTRLKTRPYNSIYRLEVSQRTEPSEDCGKTEECSDFCVLYLNGFDFHSYDFNFPIVQYRQPQTDFKGNKYANKSKPPYGTVHSVGDIFVVAVGGTVVSTDFKNETLFKQQITLNNTQIDSVYELTASSYQQLYPQTIYVKKGYGLVGYILSNKEEWLITK